MKVVTFGELLLRLAPENYKTFLQADRFEASYGGGEANVAVSLANFGVNSMFVTKLAENDIGANGVNSLRRYGVDTSEIVRGGERTGIYFVEKGASQRPSNVIYDRAFSSIAKAKVGEFDFEKIFCKGDWFHFSGITPALSQSAMELTFEAVKTAKKCGVVVSCDLNFRRKLWNEEKAYLTMSKLCEYVDVCMANEYDAVDMLGVKHTSEVGSNLNCESVARQLVERYGFRKVALSVRTSISASDNKWRGVMFDGKFYESKEYLMHIVDRVGGGDSFSAGVIYGLITGKTTQETIDFAVASSCLKHEIEGDFNLVSVSDVMRLVGGDETGRVLR